MEDRLLSEHPGKLLPRWKCHKIVNGEKVVRVEKVELQEQRIPDDTLTDWILANGVAIPVSHELRHRGGPDPVGGYYVFYESGFESWSPPEPFEAGYTKIED